VVTHPRHAAGPVYAADRILKSLQNVAGDAKNNPKNEKLFLFWISCLLVVKVHVPSVT
jgi:hypothetical protein